MAGGGGASTTEDSPEWKKAVGITMALLGSFFIGAAFIFQKKAHMAKVAGDTSDLAYLKSPLWWTGMVMMGIGEIGNFGAYAFQPAIVVAPLGALSVAVR
jgi:hypothetical protein